MGLYTILILKSRSILKKIQPILESPATLWLLTIMGISDIVLFPLSS